MKENKITPHKTFVEKRIEEILAGVWGEIK